MRTYCVRSAQYEDFTQLRYGPQSAFRVLIPLDETKLVRITGKCIGESDCRLRLSR